MKKIEQEQEYINILLEWDEYRRKRALKALFEKGSIGFELEDFNYAVRAFCWIKTLICLLLKRTNGSYLDNNKFCILAYDEYQGYESIDWEACWVSPYFFKDWNVCIGSDGT